MPVVAVLLATAMSSGCVTASQEAAFRKGRTEAGVILPAWPEVCRRAEIHAALNKGEDIRSILKRERAALDRLNKQVEVCARYYDKLRELLGNDK